MTINLQLPPEVEQKLFERAAQGGRRVEDVAAELISEALGLDGGRASRTIDEILAPVRRGWEESGLSDEQVDDLFDAALKKVRAGKRKDVPG